MTNPVKFPVNEANTSVGPIKSPPNKWARAALLALVGGALLLFAIGVVQAMIVVFPGLIAGGRSPYYILAFIILPLLVLKNYLVLAGAVSFVFGVMSIVKAKGTRNTLGIVMTIISGLIALQLPNFLATTFGFAI